MLRNWSLFTCLSFYNKPKFIPIALNYFYLFLKTLCLQKKRTPFILVKNNTNSPASNVFPILTSSRFFFPLFSFCCSLSLKRLLYISAHEKRMCGAASEKKTLFRGLTLTKLLCKLNLKLDRHRW